MGDNTDLGDRDGVRTPMQWSDDRNAGFSNAAPHKLALPVIDDPQFSYAAINVAAQDNDPHSLLNWIRQMLALRRRHRAFARGAMRFAKTDDDRVIAYLRTCGEDVILCAANLSSVSLAAKISLPKLADYVPIELAGGTTFPVIGRDSYPLTFQPYAYFWLKLTKAG
jgi:maltose alpha-D-glucosyltransferase/alpha-amylase